MEWCLKVFLMHCSSREKYELQFVFLREYLIYVYSAHIDINF